MSANGRLVILHSEDDRCVQQLQIILSQREEGTDELASRPHAKDVEILTPAIDAHARHLDMSSRKAHAPHPQCECLQRGAVVSMTPRHTMVKHRLYGQKKRKRGSHCPTDHPAQVRLFPFWTLRGRNANHVTLTLWLQEPIGSMLLVSETPSQNLRYRYQTVKNSPLSVFFRSLLPIAPSESRSGGRGRV